MSWKSPIDIQLNRLYAELSHGVGLLFEIKDIIQQKMLYKRNNVIEVGNYFNCILRHL